MKSDDALLANWEKTFAHKGDAPAIFDTKGKVLRTFAQIEKESRTFEKELLREFREGEVIAIQAGNHVAWPALLLAKALFILVFIHVFSFAADVAIVVARGFEPRAYLPQLLLKQIVLAAALTVPAAALAAVTRNLPQFIFAGVAIATVGLFSLARIEPPSTWVPVDEARRAIVLAVLAPFSTAIVMLQYARRWTAPSRALGLTAVLVAGMLFMYLPHSLSASLGCGLSQAPAAGHTLSIRLTPRNEPGPYGGYRRNIEQIRIPVVVSGIPENTTVEFDPLAFAIIGPGGERWEAKRVTLRGWYEPRLPASTRCSSATVPARTAKVCSCPL